MHFEELTDGQRAEAQIEESPYVAVWRRDRYSAVSLIYPHAAAFENHDSSGVALPQNIANEDPSPAPIFTDE